jgi:hypothetical protein
LQLKLESLYQKEFTYGDTNTLERWIKSSNLLSVEAVSDKVQLSDVDT